MDSDHRAAAREAELRALRAEKEALSQQNRRTWSLLEERTNENHQLVVRPTPLQGPCSAARRASAARRWLLARRRTPVPVLSCT